MNIEELRKYISEHNKTHVVFDFDGTIVLLDINWEPWTNDLEGKLKSSDPTFAPQTWRDTVNAQNDFIKRYGQKFRDDVVQFSEKYEHDNLKDFRTNQSLFPLFQLPGLTFALWTGNARSTVLPILKELGLEDKFGKIVARDDVFYGKPDSEGFDRIIYDPAVPKSRYLMLGDSDYDKMAAKNAGIDFLKVNDFA